MHKHPSATEKKCPYSWTLQTFLQHWQTNIFCSYLEYVYLFARCCSVHMCILLNYLSLFQILSTVLVQIERRKGFLTSGIQFIFWLLLFIAGVIPFYSKILNATDIVSCKSLISSTLSQISLWSRELIVILLTRTRGNETRWSWVPLKFAKYLFT